MQIETSHRLEIPPQLRHKLESYRRRVWLVKLAEGILAGLCGLVMSYLLVFVLDRLGDTPAGLRLLLLLVGVTGCVLWLPLKWHRWVWRTRQLEQAARLLRHQFPRIGDQLLGIVELAHSTVEQERSESLCRAAMRQVDEEVRDCDFRGAVPHPRHRHWGWAAGSILAVVVAAWLVVPSASMNALARWLFPWQNTERYTFAQLQQLPDQLFVPYAEPFLISARLTEQSVWLPPHAHATYGKQAPVEASLEDSRYQFSLPPQKEPNRLTISVGDANKKIQIDPTSRPELTEITARVTLPEYLRYHTHPVQDVRSGTVSVVQGSRVELSAVATRTLARADSGDTRVPTSGKRIDVPPLLVTQSHELRLQWQDELGLQGKTPLRLKVTALDDAVPSLSCSKVQPEQVVLSTDVISFEVLAQDDYGVKSIGVEWKGIEDPLRNPHPAAGEQIVAVGQPEGRELPAQTLLSTSRLGIAPQSLQVRVFAVDYLPDRRPTYSRAYVFHVLSPEEHAIWLTQQLGKWLRQANEVYEREQQLFETNKLLRALAPEELDRPETRRRIEVQASAERSNAQSLTALTQSGDELITQAAHNDQFNVATLENWATMLQSLKDIAGKRMPSVADLLTQAANAPGSPPESEPGAAAEAAKSPPQVGNLRDSRAGPAGESAPGNSAAVPSVTDVESGFNELQKPPDKPSASAGAPSLRLPTTDIVGGGAPQEDDLEPPGAEEKVAQAVTQQEDLLAEFAKVADELKKILGDLEGSTFVKRLKAAARRQLDLAKDLNENLAADFGMNDQFVDAARRENLAALAQREIAHGDDVFVIQDDLEAYENRVRQGKFRTVLDEMKETQVVINLHNVAQAVTENYRGQSIAQAEFWADTLDRWAEQLVGPGCPSGGS